MNQADKKLKTNMLKIQGVSEGGKGGNFKNRIIYASKLEPTLSREK